MSLDSTVPGAVARLAGHLQAVADRHKTLNLGVYVGRPVKSVADNFVAIGDPLGNGEILTGYIGGWQGMRQSPTLRRTETYGLHVVLRMWAGDVDPIGRLTDAFAVISALMNLLGDDVRGGADEHGQGGVLSPSGMWAVGTIDNTVAGPIDGKGYGTVFEFDVDVEGVSLNAAT